MAAEQLYKRGEKDPVGAVRLPGQWRRTQNIAMQARVEFLHQSEFIGFTARDLDNPQHEAIVFHGSQTIFDWIDDFEFSLDSFPYIGTNWSSDMPVRTEYGFTQLYESLRFTDVETGTVQSLAQFLSTVSNEVSYTVAGHSLGGALAALHGAAVGYRGAHVTSYTYAAPMVGDKAFAEAYQSLVKTSYTIVNKPDIVPKLPGSLLQYDSIPQMILINSLEYPEIKHCLTCYHHLTSYLYTLGCSDCDLGLCRRQTRQS
ncbi:hypothetical protein [Alicyclobacillus sp. SO9]|uniref:lipase family protein n=1 Tax=Alicyclobacillus sp. SO9 TaxID=2665646 RepID=UPI0018E79075|nr:hypothetical protein [Alicyclobacillus sp. SO9]